MIPLYREAPRAAPAPRGQPLAAVPPGWLPTTPPRSTWSRIPPWGKAAIVGGVYFGLLYAGFRAFLHTRRLLGLGPLFGDLLPQRPTDPDARSAAPRNARGQYTKGAGGPRKRARRSKASAWFDPTPAPDDPGSLASFVAHEDGTFTKGKHRYRYAPSGEGLERLESNRWVPVGGDG